jgi:hypothetical protein
MAAQPGASILLQYGTQPAAAQAGASILLDYTAAAGAESVSIRSNMRGKWAQAIPATRPLDAVQPGALRSDQSRDAPWVAASVVDNEDQSSWVKSARTDDQSGINWGAFGEAMNEERGSRWKASQATDDYRTAPWLFFGEAMNEDRGGRWKGSKAVDDQRAGIWPNHLRQVFIIQPYAVAGNAAHFAVIGGGIDSAIMPDVSYTPPAGNAIVMQFGAGSYTPFVMPENPLHYQRPPRTAADFRYAPVLIPLLDYLNQPVFDAAIADTHYVGPWGRPVHNDRESDHHWTRYSRPLNPGWGIVAPIPPEEPTPGQSIILPVRSVYIVINEIILARADDGTPIAASQMSIRFDCDSWLPTFSATIPEAARDAVMPDPSPVEIVASINGSDFRFFVERVARTRSFGKAAVAISGRGIACELDAPYATASQHLNTSAMTAQQIIDAALEYTTYSQTWNITDWLIPANTFSHYGTPSSVAGIVAEASGSVLAADWYNRDLRMLPRYPVKPWEWNAPETVPEYIIPCAITQTESLEWLDKPTYNVVYVSGEQNGIIGQVKITGTAGDKPAQMVTHPLITHADAARQRGISILGDTGRKAMMQISMPILPQTGVIDICRLIEFSDGANTRRGIVRANDISVNFPTVRQTLTIEAAA